MKYLSNINLTQNELQNAVIQNLATDPTGSKEGQIYYNTATDKLRVFDGTSWVDVSSNMSGADIVTAINGSASLIDNDNLSTGANTAITNAHTHANKTVLDNTTASYSTAEQTKLSGIATGANKYTHPNHSGDVTSTGDGATAIAVNVVTNAKLAQIATSIIKGRATAGTGNVEDLTATQVRTILNVADGANNYTHPTGDGNLHVPATSTTNSGKVLTAGATAGSLSWTTPTVGTVTSVAAGNGMTFTTITGSGTVTMGTPSSITNATTNSVSSGTHTHAITGFSLDSHTHAALHTQNTDTGTTSATFQLNSGSSGPKLKDVSGEVNLRNAADNDYADLRVKNLTVEGTTTTINSNEVNLGDSNLLLNSDITTSAGNSDGGLSVKRLMADNVTRKDAQIVFDNTNGYWEVIDGAVTGTLVTSQIARKVTATIGDGTTTAIAITHNLNTRDVQVSIRSASTYEIVYADVVCTTVNAVTITFATAPAASAYVVTIIG